MSNSFLQYLDSIKFFSPSIELSTKLARRIDLERRNDLEKAISENEQSKFSQEESDELLDRKYPSAWNKEEDSAPVVSLLRDNGKFSHLTDEDAHLQGGKKEKNEMSGTKAFEIPKTDSTRLQIFISEQIYQLLAYFSREEEAKKGNSLAIDEILSEEVSITLGLPNNEPLLADLANEFKKWIAQVGECLTDWGKIIYCEGDRVYLTSFNDW